MAIASRPMHIPAGLPLDEATRPELLDVGSANVANRNVRSNERGALEKRLGFSALSSDRMIGTARAAGRKLFAHGDSAVPCTIDGTYLDVYSTNAAKWTRIGRVPEASYTVRDLPTPTSGALFVDSEYVGGFLVVAAQRELLGQPTVAVIDYASGAVVIPHTNLGSAAAHIVLASYGVYVFAFVYDYLTTAIVIHKLDTTALSSGWSSLATVAASSGTFGGVVPSACSMSDRVAVVYGTTTGTDRVLVKTYNAAGIISTATIATSSVEPSHLDIDASDVLWVAWARSSTVYACALSTTTLSTVVGSTAPYEDFGTCQNIRICASTTAQTARAFVQDSAGGGNLDIADLTISGGVVIAVVGTRLYNVISIGRPFCRSGRYYMAVAPSPSSYDISGNSENKLCVLVDWTDNEWTARPICNIEPGLSPSNARYAKPNDIGNGRWAFGFLRLKSGSGSLSDLFLGNGTVSLALAEVDFVGRDRWSTASVGALTFLGGGVLSTFDGSRVVEAGFLSRPRTPTTDVTVGTGLTAATGFRFVAIYEDVDANGNWTVSGISNPSASTGAFTNKTCTVSASTISVTSRIVGGAKGTVRIAFYRTQDGGEPPYYRVGATAVDLSIGSPNITFSDSTTTDAILTTRAKLYAPSLPGTLGESLDRRAPAGLRHVVSYADMLVGAKGSSLVYSGQPVYGEATWFSPIFENPITAGGDITAIASQDGSLVVFKRDRVFVVSGEIPSDNGAAGGLGSPRMVASDVGCIDAASVVSTSLGVFFLSDRGIEIFSRAQTVEWIGEPVQDTLAAYPVVTSAVVDVRNNLVRFSLANNLDAFGDVGPFVLGTEGNEDVGGGRDIVFDLTLKSWISVDDKTGGTVNTASQHACYAAGHYTWITSGGTVYVERDVTASNKCLDVADWVPASYTLPAWKLGLQQDHRVREMMLLFERTSDAGLVVEVAEDFGAFAAVTANKTWTVAALAGQIRVPFRPRENGSAVQLRISDTAPSGAFGTGAGFVWIGISADIGPKQGATRGTPRLNTGLRR